MSRVPKWKNEKSKVKVVFRLQFHATHIPQTGWDKLFVSFIPLDTGKATSKTTKGNVRNGTCRWSDPIYEATRLLFDVRTKRYDEKFYKLVVAMGSSRSSILGEVDINLADFAEALQPSSVALPLHGSDYGTVLHVTIQLLTTKTGFREFELQREVGAKSPQGLSDQRSYDSPEIVSPSSDASDDKGNLKNKRTETYVDLPSVVEVAESNEGFVGIPAGTDRQFLSSHSSVQGDEDPHGKHFRKQGSPDWVHGWNSDYSADNDLSAVQTENNKLRMRLEVAESAFFQVKTEAKSLQRIADQLGAETRNILQQLIDELASGEQLAREVSTLKVECSNLKGEVRQLKMLSFPSKASMSSASDSSISSNFGNNVPSPENLIQVKMNIWLQGLRLIENKVHDIQSKSCMGYGRNNIELSDFSDLKRVIVSLKENIYQVQNHVEFTEYDLDGSSPSFSLPHQLANRNDTLMKKGASPNKMEEKVCELLQKLEESRTEKEDLMEKMNHMKCSYGAFIHEIEERQKLSLKELESLRNEHSSCPYRMSLLQTQIEEARQEMNDQMVRISESMAALGSQNKELEKRAIASETVLKRVRKNYSLAVDRLQKDLKLLSLQVMSMYESNETLAKQVSLDAHQCYADDQHLEATSLYNNKNDLMNFYLDHYGPSLKQEEKESRNANPDDVSRLMNCRERWPIASPGLLNDAAFNIRDSNYGQLVDKQVDVQQLSCSMSEAELLDIYSMNIQCKVFSDILQGILCEINNEMKLMNGRILELEQQLADYSTARESLVVKLDASLHQAKVLEEAQAIHVSKRNDLMQKNDTLEKKLREISAENDAFSAKLVQLEKTDVELKSCEAKYKACSEERNQFQNALMQENLRKNHLEVEIGSLIKELETVRQKYEEKSSDNDRLKNAVTLLQNGLEDLQSNMVFCSKKINDSTFDDLSQQRDLQMTDYHAVVVKLGEFHKKAFQKILEFKQEREQMEETIGRYQSHLKNTELEMFSSRQKLEADLEARTIELDASAKLAQKLEQKLLDVSDKLKISLKAEEMQAGMNRDLMSKLELMEVELQRTGNDNKSLLQKLEESKSITEELELTKTTLSDCKQETLSLLMTIQSKQDVLLSADIEIRTLRELLEQKNKNLLEEKHLREDLESAIGDLTLRLNEKESLLLVYDNYKAEIVHLKGQIRDLEKENNFVQHLLVEREESWQIMNDINVSLNLQLASAENHVSIVFEDVLVNDVQAVYLKSQLFEFFVCSDVVKKELEEVHLKYISADTSLRTHISNELVLLNQNEELKAALHALNSELEDAICEKEALVLQNDGMERALYLLNFELQNLIHDRTTNKDHTEEVHDTEEMNHIREPSQRAADPIIHKFEEQLSWLKDSLAAVENEMESLISTVVQLELTNIILQSEFLERNSSLAIAEKYVNDIQEKYNELMRKHSEQISKTEEYRNISEQLRELKEKAETDYHQVCKKRESERSPRASQDSLRIAFIKEQYETKIQDMKNQEYLSKRYAEEMLLKLQNALDEVECGKRNEISLAKRIEELSIKLSDMEVELREVSSERKEVISKYDSIKTELECSMLSLDCCREEKNKLEDSFRDCLEEKAKIRTELDLIKRLMENMVSVENISSNTFHRLGTSDVTSIEQVPEIDDYQSGQPESCCSVSIPSTEDKTVCTMNPQLSEDYSPNIYSSPSSSSKMDDKGCIKESVPATYPFGSQDQNKDVFLDASTGNNSEEFAHKNFLREQHKLVTEMNLFQQKLEQLKLENLSALIPIEVDPIDPSFPGLERSLSQLDMANEHLRSIYPSFEEIPWSGNALERVLALELELAEALQAKKKSEIRFQSSFLKHHNDEEAVFQSFRDINELIQDMLELKRRHVGVEGELKEMQNRYSQLSLQFAEVEGERQKLLMTIKSRASKKS